MKNFHIIFAIKPFKGNFVSNAIQSLPCAMNVDDCRVEPTGERLGGGGEKKATFVELPLS